MKQFNISLLEQYSGIKAHTIRSWERRYGLFDPRRSAGNRRHYCLDDVKLILDISILTRYGYQISRLTSLNAVQVRQIINQLEHTAAAADICTNRLLLHFLQTDIIQFEQVLSDFAQTRNMHSVIDDLIIPFMERAQLLSYTDSSPSAHFAVTAIRKKLIAAIEQTGTVVKNNIVVLLFLPKGQHYDLILLYLAYHLQRSSYRVLYLGTNISPDNLREVYTHHQADVWVTYVPPGDKTDIYALKKFAHKYVNKNNFLISTSGNSLPANTQEKVTIHYSEVLNRISDVFKLSEN